MMYPCERKGSTYPDNLRRFRKRFNETDTLTSIMDQLNEELEFLKTVKFCVSLGTGYGEFDIKFIHQCLPNLRKLIVVEKDQNCVKELRVNLKNELENKLQLEVYEMSIETFVDYTEDLGMFSDQKVDMVIAFHVLYFLSSANRLKMFKLCFEKWLTDEGMFLFANATRHNSMVQAFDLLRPSVKDFQHCEIIKSEIELLNFSIIIEKPYVLDCDLKFDGDLYNMFSFNHLVPLTEEKVEEVLKFVAPDGKGKNVCELCVVKRL